MLTRGLPLLPTFVLSSQGGRSGVGSRLTVSLVGQGGHTFGGGQILLSRHAGHVVHVVAGAQVGHAGVVMGAHTGHVSRVGAGAQEGHVGGVIETQVGHCVSGGGAVDS